MTTWTNPSLARGASRPPIALLAALAALAPACADDIANPFLSGTGTGTSTGGADMDGGQEGLPDGDSTRGGASATGTTQAGSDGVAGSGSTAGVDDTTAGVDGTDTGVGSTSATTTTGMGGTDSSTGGGASSSDGGLVDMTPCPNETVTEVPTTINGTTAGELSEFVGTCGGGGAADASYELVAPVDGFYTVDVSSGAFDPVAYVLDGLCGGNVIVCDDDGGAGNSASTGVFLSEGQTATIVVDSFSLQSGAFVLDINLFAGTCPDMDLGNVVPQTINGTTAGGDNTLFAACGGNLGTDESFVFTSPADAVYTFDTVGSDFDTVLYVKPDCDTPEVACNDNLSGVDTDSAVSVNIAAGDSVVVVVDGAAGASGNFTLNIDQDQCPDGDLGNTVPQTLNGSTATEVDSTSASCTPGASPDASYTFTAPTDGTYVFDTIGSGYDADIYVLDGAECNAPELACDADTVGQQGQIGIDLLADQTIVVVVDGSFGASGDFTLNVDRLEGVCPNSDLGNVVPQTVNGDTSVSDNTGFGTCGGLSGNDEAYTFTAPNDGLFLFDTVASATDTVLYIYDGADCTGPELTCSDNVSFAVAQSAVNVPLLADQVVTIVVDGNEDGPFTLQIEEEICPDIDLGNVTPQTVMGSTAGEVNVLAGTCIGGGAPEVAHLFTAPADGTYIFDTFGSGYDTGLYALDGVCGGAQLACNDDTGGLQSQITVNLAQDQVITVVVDGFGAGAGDYTLNVSALLGVCPEFDLGSTVPNTVMGDTSLGDNGGGGTCGGLTGNDDTYTFVAPNDGLFVFDTFGSAIDTVLYAHQGADCTGVELACNNDTGGPQSVITLPLATDDEVVIVVDSIGGDGTYTLNVTQDVCPDEDIGGTSPDTINGTTVGSSNSLGGTCGGGGAPDHAMTWVAPAGGLFVFDSVGTGFDTVMYLLDGNTCGAPELACNDDTFGLQSEVSANLVLGQEITIVMDGFGAGSGPFTLNITGP